jgi:hypothetical protein
MSGMTNNPTINRRPHLSQKTPAAGVKFKAFGRASAFA